MRVCRLLVTAHDEFWLRTAALEATGYASSVIGCDAEAAVEQWIPGESTLDQRPGVALLFFAFDSKSLARAVQNRVGQCLLTCPTTGVFNGLPEAEQTFELGKQLRYFGDGFQKSKQIAGRRFWRIPVMDGEFVVEDRVGYQKGVAGGNFLIQAKHRSAGLEAARQAVNAISELPDVITPFPGGVVRSGSKVGSRYRALKASTSDAYCPTLKNRTPTQVHPDAQVVYEIVIDGCNRNAVDRALAVGIRAACIEGVAEISAGNYGGKLGPHLFHLHEILSSFDQQ